MPNLILEIDLTQFYDSDLERYYDFEECFIDDDLGFRLLKAKAIIQNEDSLLYLLVDKEGLHLSVLRLVKVTIKDITYFQIKKSYSPIPKMGYGYVLYKFVFQYHRAHIISDSYNTLPGSYNIWMKIIQNESYNCKILNLETGKQDLINKPIDELKIWGVETDYLDEIEQTNWEPVLFEDEFNSEGEDDDYDEGFYVNYLSEHDKYERNMVSDFVVRALKKGVNKIKDRKNTVLLILNDLNFC